MHLAASEPRAARGGAGRGAEGSARGQHLGRCFGSGRGQAGVHRRLCPRRGGEMGRKQEPEAVGTNPAV